MRHTIGIWILVFVAVYVAIALIRITYPRVAWTSLACCGEIIRDVAYGHYGQAMAGLVWGLIFLAATMISARPLLSLLGSAI